MLDYACLNISQQDSSASGSSDPAPLGIPAPGSYRVTVLRTLVHLLCIVMDDESNGVLVVQKFLPLLPDAYLGSFISSIFGPDSYSFQFTTHANDCSTNFITIIELFTNHCQQSVQPQCVRFSFATADGPFTAISTNRVFPFRFNLVLEAMEVRSRSQLARVGNIIVKAPKVLDGGEGVDGSDGAPPCGLLGFSERVVEPEGPGVLKRVRGGVERRGGRGGVVGDLALLPVVVVRHGAAPGAGGRGPGVGLIGHGGAAAPP